MSRITVYTRSTCAPCQTLKRWFAHKGVAFEEKNVDDNPDYLQEAIKLSGFTAVPVTLVDGTAIVGPNFAKIADLL